MNEQRAKGKLERFLKSPSFILFVASVIIYTFCLNGLWGTDHPTSFLQFDWAIWTRHSFALGNSTALQRVSVDDFKYNRYYYSALAPGTPILSLPFTIAGFIVDGQFSSLATAMVYSEFFVALINALAIVLVYKICRFYFRESTSIFIALAYGFSTISWPFATFFFQSDPSAAFDLLATFFILRAVKEKYFRFRELAFSGLALATAMTVDYVNVILFPIFLIYLVVCVSSEKMERVIKTLTIFSLFSLVGGVLIGAYDYFSFGNPFTTSEELYLGGSFFSHFSHPLILGLILNLFTPLRGLFVYCPILVFGVPGFYYMIKSKNSIKDGLLFLGLFIGIVFPYSMWYAWDAGLSYGPRFLVAAIPFLLIPVGFLIDGPKRINYRIAAYILYTFGVLTNGIAALTSALAPPGPWLESPFVSSTLPAFENGVLDSWWKGYISGYWWVIVALILGFTLVLPAVTFQMKRVKSPKTLISPEEHSA